SESRYSSLPGTGWYSHSSNPLYTPHSPDVVAASAALIKNPARPDVCRKYGLMSGVFTKKCGRKKSATGGRDTSRRESASSARVLRHVKYVYDCVKPSLASRYIILGRVNASDRKITSG